MVKFDLSDKLTDLGRLYFDWSPLICFLTAIIMFGPAWLLTPFGFLPLVVSYKPAIGFVCFVSLFFALIRGATWYKEATDSRRLKRLKERKLHHLSGPEKGVLTAFIAGGTKTAQFRRDGVMTSLEVDDIIYQAGIGTLGIFSYNIRPWAWQYLNQHRDLLLGTEDEEEAFKRWKEQQRGL